MAYTVTVKSDVEAVSEVLSLQRGGSAKKYEDVLAAARQLTPGNALRIETDSWETANRIRGTVHGHLRGSGSTYRFHIAKLADGKAILAIVRTAGGVA